MLSDSKKTGRKREARMPESGGRSKEEKEGGKRRKKHYDIFRFVSIKYIEYIINYIKMCLSKIKNNFYL